MSDGNSQNHCQERKMAGGKLCSHWLLGKNVSVFDKGLAIADIHFYKMGKLSQEIYNIWYF